MMRNVLEWLSRSAEESPEAVAFEDAQGSLTYAKLKARAREIGSCVARETEAQSPILLMVDKSPHAVAAMLGVVYAGCFYTPVDADMPEARLKLIAEQLTPSMILCDVRHQSVARALCPKVVMLEDVPADTDDSLLLFRAQQHIDTDLLYVLFTSGSTGTPKGVAVSHRSVIDFVDWAYESLCVGAGSRFGNQAPLHFDNSVLDLFLSMRTGSCVVFLPKVDFMFPARLLEDMRRFAIDTIFWVPSVLTTVAASGLLPEGVPELKNVFFCGEVMPCKTLNAWRKALPEARFINMYGPTEITDVCTWFEVDREFADEEALPIGFPCANTRILLIDGEICVAGTCLAAGYYNAPDKTAEVFVQNPLRPQVQERIYRTGDMGAYNDLGELMFLGRRDGQIKKSGYRIELGEIETALLSLEGIAEGCCLWDEPIGRILCFYVGELTGKEIRSALKKRLPKYMLPDEYVPMSSLPRTGSGKIDRMAIRQVIAREHPLP